MKVRLPSAEQIEQAWARIRLRRNAGTSPLTEAVLAIDRHAPKLWPKKHEAAVEHGRALEAEADAA